MIRTSAQLFAALILGASLTARGAVTWAEDFANPPAGRGWQAFGQTNLFQWDGTDQNLRVTWDSARPNSYFYRPLGTILAKDDDFSLAFDLWLDDIAIGTTAGKPYNFQIAVALCDFAAATRSDFFVGTGVNAVNGPRSTVEFNYFPDSGFGATFSCIAVSSNNTSYSQFRFAHDYPLEFGTGAWHRLVLSYTAGNQTLELVKTRAGVPYGETNRLTLGDAFTDFRLDTVAIASYSDEGQGPGAFSGSVLAHGRIDNLVLTLPEPPVTQQTMALSNNVARIGFRSRNNWLYTLERSTNCMTWTALPVTAIGTGGRIELLDANAPESRAFYHVKAERP